MIANNWDFETIASFARRYPHEPTELIAAAFGCGKNTAIRIAEKMGLKKDAAFLSKIRKDCAANGKREAEESRRTSAGGILHLSGNVTVHRMGG